MAWLIEAGVSGARGGISGTVEEAEISVALLGSRSIKPFIGGVSLASKSTEFMITLRRKSPMQLKLLKGDYGHGMFTSVLRRGSLEWLAGISSTMYNTAIQLCIFSSGEEELFMIVKAFSHNPLSPDDPMAGAGALCHYHTGSLRSPRLPANLHRIFARLFRTHDRAASPNFLVRTCLSSPYPNASNPSAARHSSALSLFPSCNIKQLMSAPLKTRRACKILLQPVCSQKKKNSSLSMLECARMPHTISCQCPDTV